MNEIWLLAFYDNSSLDIQQFLSIAQLSYVVRNIPH